MEKARKVGVDTESILNSITIQLTLINKEEDLYSRNGRSEHEGAGPSIGRNNKQTFINRLRKRT